MRMHPLGTLALLAGLCLAKREHNHNLQGLTVCIDNRDLMMNCVPCCSTSNIHCYFMFNGKPVGGTSGGPWPPPEIPAHISRTKNNTCLLTVANWTDSYSGNYTCQIRHKWVGLVQKDNEWKRQANETVVVNQSNLANCSAPSVLFPATTSLPWSIMLFHVLLGQLSALVAP